MLRQRPSTRWASFEAWGHNGMDVRLAKFMASITKSALIDHAKIIANDDSLVMSEEFSAGQYWCCFEIFSVKTQQLLIARVRLPRHPDANDRVDEQSETYIIQCEVATMRFLQAKVGTVPSPQLFTYEGPGSNWAVRVGASYMLIEGFYGNTLQDIEFDICNLPLEKQEHIIKQWTTVQAELAAFTFPRIGSLSNYADNGQVTIGPLAVAAAEYYTRSGPFDDAHDYFVALADARIQQARGNKADEGATLMDSFTAEHHDSNDFGMIGLLVFKDIVESTTLFRSDDRMGPFPLNHMDLGTQNILVDDDFNFLAVIDWEFAQSAPWDVNHFPMPFPLLEADSEVDRIISNPSHIAHRNVMQQMKARQLYEQGFLQAEEKLTANGSPLGRSIAESLRSPATRIVGVLEKIGVFPDMEEELTYEMIRLAYGLQGSDARMHVEEIRRKFAGQSSQSIDEHLCAYPRTSET